MRFSKYLKKYTDICIQAYHTSKGRTTKRQITLTALIKSIGFQYPCFHCFNKQRVEIFPNDSELVAYVCCPFQQYQSGYFVCLSLSFLLQLWHQYQYSIILLFAITIRFWHFCQGMHGRTSQPQTPKVHTWQYRFVCKESRLNCI